MDTDEHVNRKCLCNHISHLRHAEGGQKLSTPERPKERHALCSRTMPAKRCGSWWPTGHKHYNYWLNRNLAPKERHALCSRTMPAKRCGSWWPTGHKHYNYWLNRNRCLGVCRSLLGVRSRCLSTEGNSDNRQAKSDISLYRITPGLWVQHCSFSVTMSPSRKEKQLFVWRSSSRHVCALFVLSAGHI